MSLDFYLTEVREVDIFGANYTHNVTGMWEATGVYDALYNSEGKLAGDIIDVLEAGLSCFEANEELLTAMNPPNGWGSYHGAKKYLRGVLEACQANPAARIRVSK